MILPCSTSSSTRRLVRCSTTTPDSSRMSLRPEVSGLNDSLSCGQTVSRAGRYLIDSAVVLYTSCRIERSSIINFTASCVLQSHRERPSLFVCRESHMPTYRPGSPHSPRCRDSSARRFDEGHDTRRQHCNTSARPSTSQQVALLSSLARSTTNSDPPILDQRFNPDYTPLEP